MTSRGAAVRQRAWVLAALALCAVALAARVHNAGAYPALRDFDGAGHSLNSFALYSGRLPDPRSWSGFHPPLSYALNAALWRLAPESVPVHVWLRLASATAGGLAVALAALALARRFSPADTAVVAALVWCAPVTAIATSMIGNECLCALLVTAALVWLLRPPEAAPARHALVTGLLVGGAVLAKSTGLVALAAAAACYGVRLRAAPRRLAAALGVLVLTAGALAAPHYARLMRVTGSGPLGVVSGGVGSPDARAAMATQPPGERHLADYLRVPSATWLRPIYLAPGMLESVPGLLYASTWADGHAALLPPGVDARILRAEVATSLGGLVPTALLLLGIARILRRPREHADWLGPLAFGAALALGFLFQTWTVPSYSAVKASYLLPALLPAGYALGEGLSALFGAWRSAARLWLLGLAAGSTALTWYGWWA